MAPKRMALRHSPKSTIRPAHTGMHSEFAEAEMTVSVQPAKWLANPRRIIAGKVCSA